jgi:hypothetical protein
MNLHTGSAIVKTYTISGDSYACTAEVELRNMRAIHAAAHL